MTPADEYDRCARYGHPTYADGVCDCGAVGLVPTGDDPPTDDVPPLARSERTP